MVVVGDSAPEFSQNVWMRQEGLTFPMLSDWDHGVIHAYDAVLPDMYGSPEVASRTTFVVDTGGTVVLRRDYDTGGPDIDLAELESALASARS